MELNALQIGPYREGEVPQPLVVTFQDAYGNPLDLTGYAAEFVWRRHPGEGFVEWDWSWMSEEDYPPNVSVATVLDQTANKGMVQQTWVPGNFELAGPISPPWYFSGVMWISKGNIRISSVRYMWEVNTSVVFPTI